jgi:hypothetical protein
MTTMNKSTPTHRTVSHISRNPVRVCSRYSFQSRGVQRCAFKRREKHLMGPKFYERNKLMTMSTLNEKIVCFGYDTAFTTIKEYSMKRLS